MNNPQEKKQKQAKENKILKSFKKPWGIIKRKPMSFFLFCLFTVFAGQIGIIINIIIRMSSGKLNLVQSLYLDSVSGSFYTFSIALIASALGPLFVNFVEKSPTEFRSIKVTTISITIFILFFAGIFYSTSTVTPDILTTMRYSIDLPQFILLLLAILISLYSFNLLELDNFKEDFDDINDQDYAIKEDKEVKKLSDKIATVNSDSKGNKV